MSREKMIEARDLIKARQYTDARAILKTVDHPTAKQWLARLDEIEAEQELGDPFVQPAVKSYTTAAVIVLVLYFLLWIPGVIANLMYLNEAEAEEEAAGQSLPGVSALRTMKFFFIYVGVILAVIAILAYAVIKPQSDAMFMNVINAL